MCRQFAELNRRLVADAKQAEQHYTEVYTTLKPQATQLPNFRLRPLQCLDSEMPRRFELEEFVGSWPVCGSLATELT